MSSWPSAIWSAWGCCSTMHHSSTTKTNQVHETEHPHESRARCRRAVGRVVHHKKFVRRPCCFVTEGRTVICVVWVGQPGGGFGQASQGVGQAAGQAGRAFGQVGQGVG